MSRFLYITVEKAAAKLHQDTYAQVWYSVYRLQQSCTRIPETSFIPTYLVQLAAELDKDALE